MKCRCKKGCSATRCGCKKKGNICSTACPCTCENKVEVAKKPEEENTAETSKVQVGQKRSATNKKNNKAKKKQKHEESTIALETTATDKEVSSPEKVEEQPINNEKDQTIQENGLNVEMKEQQTTTTNQHLDQDNKVLENILNEHKIEKNDLAPIAQELNESTLSDLLTDDEPSTPPFQQEETTVELIDIGEKIKKPKKTVSFGKASIQEFKRVVSVCAVPSTGGYPLGLSWERITTKETDLIDKDFSLVKQMDESLRISKLKRSGITIESKLSSRASRSLRGRSASDLSKEPNTNQEELPDTGDQSPVLNVIRKSRNSSGCRCTPLPAQKKKAGAGSKKSKIECCGGNPKCTCHAEGLECHSGICFCAEYLCTNPLGRRQLNEDVINVERVRAITEHMDGVI